MIGFCKLLVLLWVMFLAVTALSGCASVAEDVLAGYQCEREADNRPDARQRRAECEMLMQQTAQEKSL